MKNKKYINSLLAACVLFSCFNGQAAELKRVYGKLSFGYGDWNKGFVNVDRGEVWKAVADFGAVFDRGEFASFYEMNVLNHPVEGRNHVTQFLGHYRVVEGSNFTAMMKLYMSMENKFGDELNMMYGVGYLGLTSPSGFIKPYFAVHNLSNDYTSKSMDRRQALTVMFSVGSRLITSICLMKSSSFQTGTKLKWIVMMPTPNNRVGRPA